jgi:ATP-binding cassette subfamily B multidrug efflux pump
MDIIWRITKLAARDKWRMLGAWSALIMSTLFFLTVPQIIGETIDKAVPDEGPVASGSEFVTLAGILIAVILARGFFNYWNIYLAESLSQRVSYRVRNLMYDKLQRLSFSYHDHEHTGNLMSKSTVDVEMMRNFVQMGLVRSGQMVLLIIGASTIMLITDWQLALVSLGFVPLIGIRAVVMSNRMRAVWLQAQTEMGHMTTVLQENLEGQRVVKAFGAEKYEEDKFARKNEQVYDWTYLARKQQAANNAVMQVIFWASTGVILWVGGNAVISGRITIGDMTEFILYISLLVQPIRMLGMLVNTWARAASAGERLFEVLDADSPVQEKPDAVTIENTAGHVEIDNVSFGYGGANVISNISLDVPAGSVIALLGAPGAGKTTLVSLLARFYDPLEGAIRIDGTDIRDATLESVRSTVGLVQQDVFLFSATVAENIAYGKRDASRGEIETAAKTAQLHDEILALPDGYDTLVGERGMSLSGGQRQRLSIARTLILDPPVLVLDDSTASVDAGTEAAIQAAMASVVRDRTTFIIAHRLSSIQHAQTVVVFEHGRIAEMGTPGELMAAGGLFTHLTELQYATNLNGHGPVSPGSAGKSVTA